VVQSVSSRICLLGGALTALAIAFFSRVGWDWLRSAPHWIQAMPGLMANSWPAFALGQILVAASGILPASLIAIMAGATFGLGWGIVISAASTMLGGWLAFLLSRSVLRRFIERWVDSHSAMARLDQGMTQEGWRLVMLLRVSPVMPFAMTSYGLGLTRISQRDFLLGTAASLPALVGYVAIGALGQRGLMQGQGGIGHWLAILAGVAVIVYALSRLRKAMVQCAPA
jgi:uncharacterized membrane protein YdjX (TVP38/TMEM64 family)